ncbi:MAG TPA: type II toxin-antitoxin system RelE/ParE family toxin [Planctomycetota bacterium]|nr:type II toxin-antitoxin system RelE/ParE family toxin [Planctomycetota bacterium]
MARVHLTRRALLDIEAIDRYSTEKWGDRVAAKYLADLGSGAARLGASPILLKQRPETSIRLRFYRVREHMLVCDVIGDDIYVLALFAAVMDLPARIAELEPQLVHEAELLARQIQKRNG